MTAGTADRLLGGRVVFSQAADGYRAAIDPVLLAAAAGAPRRALDLGCGAGAALLCLLARVPGAEAVGIERDPAMADFARANITANGFGARARVIANDIATFAETGFDLVMANPPYLDAARADPSPHPGKRAADIEDTPLAAWIAAAAKAASPKGRILFVHRADRLVDLLTAMAGLGEIVVLPLWPRAGQAAKRVIVRARVGSKTPLVLAPGLVLHGTGGEFTPETEAILRDGAELPLL
ncbi:MAG: tRNA1(Val) (adenine(37)-N6)-methyltransferase [Tagaea sp.]